MTNLAMTLADFRATGRECVDLGAAGIDDMDGIKGRLYLGGLFTEYCQDGSPCLTIGNMQYSGDLATLEARLFEYGASDERFTAPKYLAEFPDFDASEFAEQVKALGFDDVSWHNDSCPSFNRYVWTVFVDYTDSSLREFPECPQFSVRCVDDDILQTNDFSEVIALYHAKRIQDSPVAA